MPVLIMAPATEMDIVRPLAQRLLEDGGEVRCYLEEDDFELRQAGCKLAIGDLTDEVNLEGALTNVHTFMPVFPDPAGIRASEDLVWLGELGAAAAHAAATSSIAQTILAIPALARTRSRLGDAYRQVASGFSGVHPKAILEIGMLWGLERPFPRIVGSLTNEIEVSVLNSRSLVAALAAADDHDGIDGSWELGGEPHVMRELREMSDATRTLPTTLINEALTSDLVVGMSALEKLNVGISAISPVRSGT